MTDGLFLALRMAAALGCGLMAGLFFAFSIAVMGGLARIQPAEGIAAMQSINRVILNPLFAIAFFGTAAVCLVLFVGSAWTLRHPGALYEAAGAALYLLGCIVVTLVFNVPLNEELAAVQPTSSEGADVWRRYLATWTLWNHFRAAACLAAAGLITVAIHLQRGP